VGGLELQCLEADVVEGLVIKDLCHVAVFHQLVHGQDRVVVLHHNLRHFWRGHDAVRAHDAVRKLFPDLANQESAHSGSGAST
jgi:hypothetical protein